MKKNYFLHTAILLVALVCGSVPVWSQTYKKISSIEELTDGKYVIAYENMAMENKLMVLELLLLQSMLQIMLLLVPMHLLFGRLQQQQTV